jgi:hypothetical protein
MTIMKIEKSEAQIKAEEQRKLRNESIKSFLETAPLHRKYTLLVDIDKTTFLPIQMNCPGCKMETTHTYSEGNSDIKTSQISTLATRYQNQVYASENVTYKLSFNCQRCSLNSYFFMVTFFDKKMAKTGQYPSMDINVPHDIEQKLGASLAIHYKKGKTCYAHGLGIAAMAYYRRVIEDKVAALLVEIEELVPEEDRHKYLEAIKDVKDLHSFESKASLIYEAMPAVLRPKGNNYLKMLFGKVSEGLHSKSDEDCLKISEQVSELLEVIIHTLNQQAEAAKVIEKIGLSLKKS